MNVTRDVILDLLPLYMAGEASAGSRAIVDEYLAGDAELAAHVAREQRDDRAPSAAIAPGSGLEIRALARAQRVLAAQRWLFGLAWFFTAISLTSEGTLTSSGIRAFHLLIFRFPQIFGTTLVVAASCWAGYFTLRRRARIV